MRLLLSLSLLSLIPFSGNAAEESPKPVSFYQDIRPIFQANCVGCHQPSKNNGDYVMTDFQRLLAGGEDAIAIVPGKPDESHLIEEITPDADGDAEMPKKNDPLHEIEIALIRRWIEEGAKDDTPENARQRYDQEHPPVYTKPPVITSLDYSPDGSLLAISGFHEVLLQKADGSGEVARLVGLSERIESVRFSPDGSKLAVTGGLPGRMGEVQVWDVSKKSSPSRPQLPLIPSTVPLGRPMAPKFLSAALTTAFARSTPRPVNKCFSKADITDGFLTPPSIRKVIMSSQSVAI